MIGGFLQSKTSGYLAIASILIVLGLVWYIFNEGKNACIAGNNNAIIDKQEKDNKNEKEIRQLGDSDLVHRYCQWVSDVPFNVCVRTHLHE